jgi:uncharacterized membrane protein YqaE (UPF0057 family)
MNGSPEIVAAVLLPPQCLSHDRAGAACLLTVLGIMPGMLFALYLVSRPTSALA